jgi:thioester reductase-like protein
MLPEAFVSLEELPMLPSGKIDRQALPPPKESQLSSAPAYLAPRTPEEEELCLIWSEILDVERVGVRDSFFELGGHSLSAIRLVSRVREVFRVELPLASLFEDPTVAGMAAAIETGFAEGTVETEAQAVERDAVLDPDIQPIGLSAEEASEPRRIFLTGATGFVGAFLLAELLERTQADILCLVRSENAEEGMRKLRETLDFYSLWREEARARILPVCGDLSQPLLGVGPARFASMAEEVDAIYHCGAWVNALYPYSILRQANVMGTVEVLRLATRARRKPLHYVSSTGIFPGHGYSNGHVIREEDELPASEVLTTGYAKSKWVAEKLVAEARSRGVPVAIYRLGLVSGDSTTGICNTEDLWCRAWKTLIQFGSFPRMETAPKLALIPVDYVARAVIHLSLQERLLGKVFHLVSPTPTDWGTLLEWTRAYGYPLEAEPADAWSERMLRFLGSQRTPLSALLAMFQGSLPSRSGDEGASGGAPPSFDFRNLEEGLEGTSITCPPPSPELIGTYLSYMVRAGFLDPPEARRKGEA